MDQYYLVYRSKSAINRMYVYSFGILLFLQTYFQVSSSYGQSCVVHLLRSCNKNEMCSVSPSSNDTGTCVCLPEFIEYSPNKTCISNKPDPPPAPDNEPHTGFALAIGLIILFITIGVAVGLLHYRYGILNKVIHTFHRIRRRTQRNPQIFEVDGDFGGEDDVDPIV